MCGKTGFICAPTGAGRCGLYRTAQGRICKGQSRQAGAISAEGRFTALENRFVRNVKGGIAVGNQMRSELPPPCRGCYLVPNPVACENKDCRPWRQWFIAQWDQRRRQVRQRLEKESCVQQGVPLGGRQYYHPEKLRRYMDNDPCKACWLAKCECQVACRVKRN